MKNVAVSRMMAAAAALLVAGCGGGGDDTVAAAPPPGPAAPAPAPAPAAPPPAPPEAASLRLTGTAAVGAPLAGAAVSVKCATGSGTATTGAAGGYTVTLEGGVLPCMIQVRGDAGGVAVTLHSVTEAGTASGPRTSAVANVTPITELIVAQLAAALPADVFTAFDAQSVTATRVTAAVTAVVAALKSAGIDLGTIDPLKTELVAASGGTPGNAYDQLLDALGDKVAPQALPQLVNQVATAAATNSSTGLAEAVGAVSGGALEGCPVALSGTYRALDYFGKTTVLEVNFKDRKFGADHAITTDAAKPCEFTATGTVSGLTTVYEVVMGSQGVGGYRVRTTAPVSGPGNSGYLIPVQRHPLAVARGTWTFLQSGNDADEGNVHWAGQLTVADSGAATACDFDPQANWACQAEPGPAMNVSERSDGGFDLNETGKPGVASFHAYKSPSGAVTVFGTTAPAGTGAQRTHLVLTRLSKVPPRPVGDVSRFWDIDLSITGSGISTGAPKADSVVIKSVDEATSTVVRKRASDGREDTWVHDKPLDGLRTRESGSWTSETGTVIPYVGVYSMPLPGAGLTLAINKEPSSPTRPHVFSLSVVRP